MNDILRRVLIILRGESLTAAQRMLLYAITDLAKQVPPYSLDTSEDRLLRAYFISVLVEGVGGIEIVWRMTARDAADTVSILEIGEEIQRYAQSEVERVMRGGYTPADVELDL